MAENYAPINGSDLYNDYKGGLNDATMAAIGAILGSAFAETGGGSIQAAEWTGNLADAEGAQILVVNNATDGKVTIPANVTNPIIDASALDGVTMTAENLTSDVQAVILGQNTVNSTISFDSADTTDKTVVLNGGTASVTTAAGDDLISLNTPSSPARAAGTTDATVNTADGSDTVFLSSEGSSDISMGAGDDILYWDATRAAGATPTVDGGDGFDVLMATRLTSAADAARETLIDKVTGKFAAFKDMSNMEAIIFSDGEPQITDSDAVTIFNTDAGQSLVTRLYEVVLGRQPIDSDAAGKASIDPLVSLGGIKWWFEQPKYQNITDTASDAAKVLVSDFLGVDEVRNDVFKGVEPDAATFVDTLWNNIDALTTDGVTTINGTTKDAFIAYLEEHDNSADARVDVALALVANDEVETFTGLDGNRYSIDLYDTPSA